MILNLLEGNTKTKIFENPSMDELTKKMKDYIENVLHFKSYYYQITMVSEKQWIIDYGSHTKFFEMIRNEREEPFHSIGSD